MRPETGRRVSWRDVLGHWRLVVLDLHETFGADWSDPGLERPWPWWRARIWALLGTSSRLARALAPDDPE